MDNTKLKWSINVRVSVIKRSLKGLWVERKNTLKENITLFENIGIFMVVLKHRLGIRQGV